MFKVMVVEVFMSDVLVMLIINTNGMSMEGSETVDVVSRDTRQKGEVFLQMVFVHNSIDNSVEVKMEVINRRTLVKASELK